MIFQSIEYLIFLFAVIVIYWTVCKNSKTRQNALIVLASIAFYSWWDWRFLGLLILTTLSTYYAALLQRNKPQLKKGLIWGILVLNIGILFFFKYYNFFVESLIDSLSLLDIKLEMSTLNIILPVGISFYTFSALSYYIDVHQGKVEPTKDILAYMAYTMFFPSILSGPISKAQKQLPQYFNARAFDYSNMIDASLLFLWGAMMKLCLADRLGVYVDAVYANIAQHSGTTLLFTSILYTIQIYADFAGYSLMAIGSGKLLGINLQTNFNRPYFAITVTDFWRRWHISLSTWFRDYIYIPLGGSRCGVGRWIFNTMVVFVVSGLWHGAAYTFLLWGALHGLGLVAERLIYGDKLKTISNRLSVGNILRWGITFIFVNCAWILFRINDVDSIRVIFSKIILEPGSLYLDYTTLIHAFIAFVLVLINDISEEKAWNIRILRSRYRAIRYISVVILICYIVAFGVLNGGSFIYFQF